MSASGSRLCENSDVELAHRNFVSITLNRKRTAPAAQSNGRQGRKQFCAFFARAGFHTAWVKLGPRAASELGPLVPQQRTYGACVGRSVWCQNLKSRVHFVGIGAGKKRP